MTPTQPSSSPARARRDAPFTSSLNFGVVGLSLVYGLVFRLFTGSQQWNFGRHTETITFTFLMLGPLVIGFLAVFPVARRTRVGWARCCFQPWIPIFGICAVCALLAIEGWICIAMLLPIALLLSTMGGVLAGLLARKMNLRNPTLACLAALPFLLAPAETYLHAPTSIRTVANQIAIRAPSDVVWHQIQAVPPIAASELRPTWSHAIGFPRPIAAKLSHPGVGGVRTATFEHGLTFYETVTDWQPDRRLSFTIKADTAHIPPTTLDEHVSIGGPYFDVLDGTYQIEPLADGTTMLHLTSHQRLTTDVNNYAALWTDAIMSDLQASVLQVIQHRCEHKASLTAFNQ